MTNRLLTRINPLPGREEDILTAVSELVANAQRHAGGVTAYHATARPGTVIITVRDPSARPPSTRPWAPAQPGGFGWRLVNQLADTVTVACHHDGKTITVTFTSRG